MPTAAYDTALNIVSDASALLGLGAQTVVFASTDANVIQLRTLLKTEGRALQQERDWTHLQAEGTIVTLPAWAASTAYVTTASAVAWAANTAYVVGDVRKNASNLYQCTTAGTSNANGPGPSTKDTSISDGATVKWKFLNTGAASLVTKGLYSYTCTTAGTSGTVGPYRTSAGTETDGTVVWTWLGRGADFTLPSDFAKMLGGTYWNRTTSLPTSPLDPQEWQYIKGRNFGSVITVLFRPVAQVIRVYPDTDTTALQTLKYEYQSTFWMSATGGTTPTGSVPTVDTDIIYFDYLLMVQRLRVAFLKLKGLPTDAAQRDYDSAFERACNADGAPETLNLGARRNFDPLLSIANIPPTGYGE